MRTKAIDALVLKRKCQEEVARDAEGLSDAERRRCIGVWLATSQDKLAVFWREAAPKPGAN